MSRLNYSPPYGLSSQAVQAMFAQETNSELILLVTVYDPQDPSQVILRLADGYTGRLTDLTTDEQVVYGVVSRGEEYLFFPMSINLPDEAENSAPRCSITMYDVTRYLMPYIRTIEGRPGVKLELVLANPDSIQADTVEVTFSNLFITNFTYNVDRITADLSMINYEVEPFPQYSFTPVHFPGLF